jgi:hypothetical protein
LTRWRARWRRRRRRPAGGRSIRTSLTTHPTLAAIQVRNWQNAALKQEPIFRSCFSQLFFAAVFRSCFSAEFSTEHSCYELGGIG